VTAKLSLIAALLSSVLFLSALTGCSKNETVQHPTLQKDNFSYDTPLADFSKAAQELLALSPEGLAIGEVHGQLAGIMLLEAVVDAAKETYPSVLILHEFTPSEIGLDLEDAPMEGFSTYDPSDPKLPFWNNNIDKRATHELRAYFSKIAGANNIEVSYLWDPRLAPLPNKLKAHAIAKRWKIAKTARPDAYIVSLSGNYHTSISHQYDLDVTNSLCRYADEVLSLKLTCITVDMGDSANENCEENQDAILLKGEDIFEQWDYAVRRPDKCVVQAHWVNAPL